jgi:hypothetical protein
MPIHGRPIESVIAEFPMSDDARARLVAFFKLTRRIISPEIESREDRLFEEDQLPRLPAQGCRDSATRR